MHFETAPWGSKGSIPSSLCLKTYYGNYDVWVHVQKVKIWDILSFVLQAIFINGIENIVILIVEVVSLRAQCLLCCLCINDLETHFKLFNLILYADDTNLFLDTSNLNENITNINLELNNIANWCNANKLMLNLQKTNYM